MGYYIYLGPWRILFFPNNHFLRFVCLIQQISHTCCNCVKKCFRHNWINVSQIVPPSSTRWFDPFMNKEAFLIFCHVLLNFINTTFNFQNSLIFDFVHVIPIKKITPFFSFSCEQRYFNPLINFLMYFFEIMLCLPDSLIKFWYFFLQSNDVVLIILVQL